MRIISGIHKGRRLVAPKNLPVRPTTDFAKEGIFNILVNRYDFDALVVLDLFSGTGNMSYEFASRGVPQVTSVDGHYNCVKFIKKTSEELSLPITPIKADVFKYLDSSHGPYDIIFADPPYAFEMEQFEEMVEKIHQNNLLKPEGIFIIEHPKQTVLSDLPRYQVTRKYGGSMFSFFDA